MFRAAGLRRVNGIEYNGVLALLPALDGIVILPVIVGINIPHGVPHSVTVGHLLNVAVFNLADLHRLPHEIGVAVAGTGVGAAALVIPTADTNPRALVRGAGFLDNCGLFA